MRSPLDSLRVDCGINRYCRYLEHTEYQPGKDKSVFMMFISHPHVNKGVQSCLTHVLSTDKHTMVVVLIQIMMSWLYC